MKFFTDIEDNRILSENVKDGYYQLEIIKKRNGKFMRKYWKLNEFTLFHLPERFEYTVSLFGAEVARVPVSSKECLHGLFKYLLGVESVSFAEMTEYDFSRFYSRVLDIVCKLLAVEREDVINELVSFM